MTVSIPLQNYKKRLVFHHVVLLFCCQKGHRGNFPWITPVPFCLADKFREYIPTSKLQGSYLWDEMVEQQKKSLIREIIS